MRRWGSILLAIALIAAVCVWIFGQDEPVEFTYRCKDLAVSTTDDPRVFRFATTVDAIGSEPLSVEYNFGDDVVERVTWSEPNKSDGSSHRTAPHPHPYASPGSYKVQARVAFSLEDGSYRIVTSSGCQETIKVV